MIDLSAYQQLDVAIFEDCSIQELTAQVSAWLSGTQSRGGMIVAASPALPTGEDPETISFVVTIYYSKGTA